MKGSLLKFKLNVYKMLLTQGRWLSLRKASNFRRLVLLTLVIIILYCGIQIFSSNYGYDKTTNLEKLIHLSRVIKNSAKNVINSDGSPRCRFPDLNLTNPEIMKFIHDVPPLDCTPDDWVRVDGSKLFIDKRARNKYGSITCAIREIIRLDDEDYDYTRKVETTDYYVLKRSDYAEVKCESQNGKQWFNVMAGVKEDKDERLKSWTTVPEGSLKLNVLMFGFDSLSRLGFMRKLPKSYKYLKDQLNSLVLEGYNIVGDGTPQALIPILTGKIELELPDTRKRMGSAASFVDVYPMIWKLYNQSGYITGFMEDVPHIGTFTYRLKGFDQQPTHHYMRTYYKAAAPYFKYYNKFCMAGTPRHVVLLNYMKNIFKTYQKQPKFAFGFHGELSHDSINDIGLADQDLLKWMKDLNDSGVLNNTVLIIMSDHGNRFADLRNTLQGKQEERMPFFSFAFPKWFKQVHPRAYANFLYNTKMLTTPFDVHKTLESIINFETPKEGDLSNRAISLFNRIPVDRSCADAFIEPHWCACLAWQEVEITNDKVQDAAIYFVKFLNEYTKEHRDICEVLRLNKILWAAKLLPTKDLLNFNQAKDLDGFVGDFTANTQVSMELFQLKISTLPGNALFEASISYDVKRNVYRTKISDVSRINKYGSQARCVENIYYHLRKYCYCID